MNVSVLVVWVLVACWVDISIWVVKILVMDHISYPYGSWDLRVLLLFLYHLCIHRKEMITKESWLHTVLVLLLGYVCVTTDVCVTRVCLSRAWNEHFS